MTQSHSHGDSFAVCIVDSLVQKFDGSPCIQYSRLSLKGHLYKTDTSVKRTPRVGPFPSLLPLFDSLYKTDISLRRTGSAGPKGVRLKES